MTDRSETGGHTDQIPRGDPHLDEALGMGRGELVGLGRVGEVAVHDDGSLVGIAQSDELFAPDIAHRLHTRPPSMCSGSPDTEKSDGPDVPMVLSARSGTSSLRAWST